MSETEVINLIKQNDLFPVNSLETEVISSTAKMPKEEAIKTAVKKKHPAMTVFFGAPTKTLAHKSAGAEVKILKMNHFGITEKHPQFAGFIPGTGYCYVKSQFMV